MKILRRILLIVLLLLLLLIVGGAAAFWNVTRSPLPQHSGEVTIPGLRARVEVIRDAKGIPHIYATTLHDLFFTQGFVQAQDRWWQMEFSRHIGRGSIQELTGRSDSLMGTDVFIRHVGWLRAAERELANYDEATVSHLQAFADGVNAYIGGRAAGQLAMEYSVLGLTGVNIAVEPWTPVDTVVWAKVMQWDLGGNSGSEEFRERMIAELGEEMFAAWQPQFSYDEFPTIVQPEDVPQALDVGASTRSDEPETVDMTRRERIVAAGGMPLDSAFIFGGGSGIGSNNWVISGERTASGRPLLANDPHLGIGMPSIWYEIGLHCQPVNESCPIDVVGFAFAPSPAVIIGHNGRIAWGVTNVGPDTQDLYRIQVNPENELQYRWNDEWRDFVVYEETLSFGDGAEPVTFRVRETHLGPIITDNGIDESSGEILGFDNETALALRWTSLEPGTLWRAVLGLNTAQDWESFREALRSWDSPSQNFVYADVDGNIGYQTPGNLPVRAPGEDGRTPSDCADDSCVWQGYIPFDALPTIYNPERGYIVTANQALVPPGYYDLLAEALGGEPEQYIISHDWDVGYRGARINELVAASTAHTPESIAAIQGDNKLMLAEQLAPSLRGLELSDAGQAGVRDWMLEWDYQLHRDSARAAYWMLFLKHLTQDMFDDELAALDEAYQGSGIELLALQQIIGVPDSPWWDDVTTPDVVETPDQLMARALVEALADAESRLGADRESWRWGALHTTTFESNPLGLSGIDIIEQLVNRGPFATSGGRVAPNATSWAFAAREFVVRSAPSMRMIVDVGAFDNSLTSNTTGQSGHPFSPHYDDMIEDWLGIRHHPMHWSREAVDGAGVATLVLLPGG